MRSMTIPTLEALLLGDLPTIDDGTIAWNADVGRETELRDAYNKGLPAFRALLLGTHSCRRLSDDERHAAIHAIHHTTVDPHSLCTTCCKTAAIPGVKLCKRDALHLITRTQA